MKTTTNSRVGKKYIPTRYVNEAYPDDTGPCGHLCSCNSVCKIHQVEFHKLQVRDRHGATQAPSNGNIARVRK